VRCTSDPATQSAFHPETCARRSSPFTKASSQKAYAPTLGSKPKSTNAMGVIPALWSGPKAKKS
jgi:hypothetical protein